MQVIGGQKNRSDSSSDSDSKSSADGRVSPPDNLSGLTGQGHQEGANLEAKSASSTVSSDEFEPYNNRRYDQGSPYRRTVRVNALTHILATK